MFAVVARPHTVTQSGVLVKESFLLKYEAADVRVLVPSRLRLRG